MPFVKFSCGCIGLVSPASNNSKAGGDAIVLKACDLPREMCDEPISVWRRHMPEKAKTPLSPEEADALLKEIGGLVTDGYRFRKIRSLLR